MVVVWVLGLAGWSQASGANEEGRQRGKTEGDKECESMKGNEEKIELSGLHYAVEGGRPKWKVLAKKLEFGKCFSEKTRIWEMF